MNLATLILVAGATVSQTDAQIENQEVESKNNNVTYNLTEEHIKPIFEEAVNRWVRAGIDREKFNNVKIRITNYNNSRILAYGGYNQMSLDDNGANSGWFIDPTPAEDEEYYAQNGRQYADKNTGAEGHIDLLSVVAHELGHHLGYGHNNGSSIMQPYVPIGQRTLKIRN